MPFRIFERDANANYRCQGYRIRINDEPLEETLPPDVLGMFRHTCGISRSDRMFAGLDALTAEVQKSTGPQNANRPRGQLSGGPPPHGGFKALKGKGVR